MNKGEIDIGTLILKTQREREKKKETTEEKRERKSKCVTDRIFLKNGFECRYKSVRIMKK